MSEQAGSIGVRASDDLGAEVQEVIRKATTAVIAEAEARARAIEEKAAEQARRAAEAEARAHAMQQEAEAQLERAAEAESRAQAIEEAARSRAERAADEYEASVREDVKRARREALDAAQTRAAGMIESAEKEAAQIRKRAMDDLDRSRQRAVRESERAAEHARARLMKFADSAREDLDALIAGIKKDAGLAGQTTRTSSGAPRSDGPWDQLAA